MQGRRKVEAECGSSTSKAALPPGERAFVRFILREPLLLAPADRFIIRMFSPW